MRDPGDEADYGRDMRGVVSGPLMLAAVLLLYLAAGSLALQFVARPQNIAYFWPAAGVAVGAMIVAPRAMRLHVAVSISVAVAIANALAGRPLVPTLMFAASNTFEAWLCATIVIRLVGEQIRMASIRDANVLVIAAAIASAASALLIMALLTVSGDRSAPPFDLVRTWAIADFVGIVTVAPVVIAFSNDRLPRFDARFREGILALCVLGFVAYFGYYQSPTTPRWTDLTAFSATLPVLVWLAARAPRQLATAAPALLAFIVLWLTVRGFGPYAHPEYAVDDRIIAAQFELIIFAVLAIYLSGVFAAYRRALDEVSARRAELEARFVELEALYAEAPLGLGMLDADLRFVRINEALAEMNGFSTSQHIGRSVWDLMPALREEAEPVLRKVLETGEALRDVPIHGVTPAKPGQIREWCEQFYPIKFGGAVVGIGIVCEEVTEKRRAQDRERLLSREVDHRAKNLLAVVHSIVQLSKADDVESYRQAISSRIQSLSRTHSLLAGSRWEGSSLTKLVSEELAPFLRSSRIRISGDDVHLSPTTTQDVALILHELATNAVKYGALSVQSGELSVAWRHAESDDCRLLKLDWKESGGPPVKPPERLGFGSALVEATLGAQMRGSAQFSWHAEGLQVELAFPLQEATAPRAAARAEAPNDDASSRPLSGRRVLLIEDEPLIGLHAQNCLESAGCEVVGPIARLEPALVAAREAAFDFAIIDINLAGLMTFPVADLLVQRGTPFVFCSGYSSTDDVPDRFAHIPVLRKPLSETALVDAVADWEPV